MQQRASPFFGMASGTFLRISILPPAYLRRAKRLEIRGIGDRESEVLEATRKRRLRLCTRPDFALAATRTAGPHFPAFGHDGRVASLDGLQPNRGPMKWEDP